MRVTAARLAERGAPLRLEDTALVLGASGGVGSIIVSAARALGATVIGQAGHEASADWISQRGADQVPVISRRSVRGKIVLDAAA